MRKSRGLKINEEFEVRVSMIVEEVKSEMQKFVGEYDDSDEFVSSVPVTTGKKVGQGHAKKCWMDKLQNFRGGTSQSSNKKTELEKYLLEDVEEMREKFDILLWWNVNSSIYPTLARMAKGNSCYFKS
ncbi:putative HAT dimerization domain, ribonuclease H-like superfamily [Helianthus annuus]|nr:putative HAT dimerization domain, ribonuclease H-like superfamily [Helianthus annuus]